MLRPRTMTFATLFRPREWNNHERRPRRHHETGFDELMADLIAQRLSEILAALPQRR
jgi:hypothetical protein